MESLEYGVGVCCFVQDGDSWFMLIFEIVLIINVNGGSFGGSKMIYFYICNYRIEIRRVRFPHRYNKRFLFLKYFKSKPSPICKSCINVRPQYKNCKKGIPQQVKKGCCYKEE